MNQGVALAGVEGERLLVHGLGVELGKGVGGAAEGRVNGPVRFVHRRHLLCLPFPRHHKSHRSLITHAIGWAELINRDPEANGTLERERERGRYLLLPPRGVLMPSNDAR